MSRHHPNMSMETYYGSVRTTADAIKLFEACRVGTLPRVQRRLSEKERQAIRPGSVFVWDEREAGMRRWTDGKSWSASRVSGSFLTYREMEGKRAGFGGRRNAGRTPDSARASDEDRGSDDHHEGYRYKADGLMKQSFSITTSHGQHLHLISYYARDGRGPANLPDPSSDPALRHVSIPKGIYPESSVSETSVPVTTRGPMQRHSPYSHPRNAPPPYHQPYDPNVHAPPPGPGYWGPISPVATPPYNGHPAPYPPGPPYHPDGLPPHAPPHYAHHPQHFSPPQHHMAALPPPPAGKPGIQLPQPQPYPHQHAVQAPYPPPLSQPPPPAYHYLHQGQQQPPPPQHQQPPYHHQVPPHPSQQPMHHHQGPPPPHHHLPSPQLPSDVHHPEHQPQQPQQHPRIAPIDSPKSQQLMAAARETLNLDSRLAHGAHGSGPLPPPQQQQQQQQQNGTGNGGTPFSGSGAVPTPPLPPTSSSGGVSSPRHHQELKPVLSPLSLHPPLAAAPQQQQQQNGGHVKPSSTTSPISASTRPSLSAILLPPPNPNGVGIKTESNGATPVSANGARSPLGSPNGLGPHGVGHVPVHGLAAAPDNKAYEALKALNRNLCT
ncbi:Gti1/Pac2 family-domain-containing protein [Neurospora tetraspora]|uniref:Gti1/Pac2 family-domain-containing protein n=1 Tax=Neurospora tetraspora TaxID=94610 RepID=A0AAE0MT48_9PEZI|nr:Gti1/Pac2 family-domain-containing protein [Neurospora tetraspora]